MEFRRVLFRSIKTKIAFFESNKPGGLVAPVKRTTRQPARKPKKKKQ